jgi:hypothetical protein
VKNFINLPQVIYNHSINSEEKLLKCKPCCAKIVVFSSALKALFPDCLLKVIGSFCERKKEHIIVDQEVVSKLLYLTPVTTLLQKYFPKKQKKAYLFYSTVVKVLCCLNTIS